MKTACLILVMMCGLVTGSVAASNPASQQASAQVPASKTSSRPQKQATPSKTTKHNVGGTSPSALTGRGRSSHVNHPRNTRGAGANRPQELSQSQQRFTARNHRNLSQTAPGNPGAVGKTASFRNNAVNTAPTVREPSLFPSSTSSLENVRHRSPNPAIVGGAGNSRASSTGALDGSRMSRKP